MLGRGKKHFILRLLKQRPYNPRFIETYHFVLARKRSKPSSRLALFGRIMLTKGLLKYSDKTNVGTFMENVHFFTFDFKRLFKYIESPNAKTFEISPLVKDLLNLTMSKEKIDKLRLGHKKFVFTKKTSYRIINSNLKIFNLVTK